MDPIRVIRGTAAPLDRSDVDTDQIIPASWLKRVERSGFGVGLFSAWRESDPNFVLNRPEFSAGKHSRHRAELRHWLIARACRLGPHRFWLSSRGLAPFRGHLSQQRDEVGTGAGGRLARVCRGAIAGRRARSRARNHSSTLPSGGSPRRRSDSNTSFHSTRLRNTGCSRGWTTSG